MELAKLLWRGHDAVSKDKTIFTLWEQRAYTIERVINEFRKHNKIDKEVDIKKSDMVNFMNSLGYRR